MPEIDETTPLREEILAGRPIVAVADPGLEGSIVEAARVAGRLGDLVVIASDNGRMPPMRDGGAATLLPPTTLQPVGRNGIRLHERPEFRDLPCLGEAPVDWSRAILVARLGSHVGPGADLPWMIESLALDAARGRGGPLPVRFRRPTGVMSRYGWPKPGTEGTFRLASGPCLMVGDRAAPAPDADVRDWSEALRAYRRGLKVHEGRRLSAVMSDERLVILHACHAVRRDERRPVTVAYEIDAQGVIRGLEIRSVPESEEAFHELAMAAFTGGLEYVRHRALWTDRIPERGGSDLRMASCIGAIFMRARDEEAGETLRNLRDMVSHRVDVELATIASRGPHAEAVVRLVASDPARAADRKEFCRTWPGLAHLLVDPEVLAVVDARGETLPAVAGKLGVSQPIARRLVGRRIMPPLLMHSGEHRPESNYRPAELLGALGHDRLPRAGDAAQWQGLVRVCGALRSILGRCGANVGRIPVGEVTALMLGGPDRTWEARGKTVKGFAPQAVDLGDIGDMVIALAGWLHRLGRPVDTALAFRVMARHGSIARLHAASMRWHDTPSLRGGGLGEEGLRWPVPFDAVDLGDGWSAVALDGVAALSAEGGRSRDAAGMAGLDHCVGGYDARCQTGESLIVSLRRSEGEATRRVSTAELKPWEAGEWLIGGRGYRLAQHRALANAAPDADARGRLERLRLLLAEGAVPIREEALERREAGGRRTLSRDEHLALHEAWRPLLPESVRGLDIDGLERLLATMEAGLEPPRERDIVRAEQRFRIARNGRPIPRRPVGGEPGPGMRP